MGKKSTPLVDEHLQSIGGIKEADTDDFFYTRMKAKMVARQEKESHGQAWVFPLKPIWVVGTLVLLLAVNGFILSQQFKARSTASNSSLQSFAESYDQTISSSY